MSDRIVVTVTEKGGAPREEAFDQPEIVIGRVQGNDIVLPKGNISKRHARIVLRDGKLIVVDLKTTNGTFVNGKRISSPQVLRDADKVYVGDFTLVVRAEAGGARRASGRPSPPPAPPSPPPSIPPSRAGSDAAVLARHVVAVLKDSRAREIVLREDEPLETTPAGLAPGATGPTSRHVIVGLLRGVGVAMSDERPVFDGPVATLPQWRVTAQALDGAPARARFRRATLIAIDDDLDPVPPG